MYQVLSEYQPVLLESDNPDDKVNSLLKTSFIGNDLPRIALLSFLGGILAYVNSTKTKQGKKEIATTTITFTIAKLVDYIIKHSRPYYSIIKKGLLPTEKLFNLLKENKFVSARRQSLLSKVIKIFVVLIGIILGSKLAEVITKKFE